MKKGIIFIILAIISVIVASSGFRAAKRGVGDMEMVKGELHVEEGAADEDFQIQTDAALLLRTVEMFQYVKSDISEYSYDTGFYEKHMPNVTVKTGSDNEKTYHNPSFPENLKSETFCGKVLLGDSGLYVADKLLKKISLNSYIDFKNEHYIERLQDLPADGGEAFGLTLYDGFYADKPDGWSPSDGWKVGDIRVKYYTVMPEEDMTYTVAGDVNGNVIGEGQGDNVSYIYDYDTDKTVEEIANDFETSNRRIGIGGSVFAVLFMALGVISIVRARKEA